MKYIIKKTVIMVIVGFFLISLFSILTPGSLIDWVIFLIYTFFFLGTVDYLMHRVRLFRYFKKIKKDMLFLKEIDLNKHKLPKIVILVPARNEGYVIENTIRRLAKINYPKTHYTIVVIVDERELEDDVEVFTKTVVQNTAISLEKKHGVSFIRCIEVPSWYSGVLDSYEKTYKKSTKGRALNYALQTINLLDEFKEVEMIGILDADGRLDIDVLREVAYKRLKYRSKILQGPVFQISNFNSITIVGVAAGLELAIHHMTELPSKILNNRVQFLAGTNYFIDKDLITDVGGWDQDTLVEDAELSLRIFSKKRVKSGWLSSPELEQSPEGFSIYKKQRERWARGHLHLIKYVLKSKIPLRDKMSFLKNIIFSQTRFLIDFCVPLLALYLLCIGAFSHYSKLSIYLSFFFLVTSVCIFDLYGFVYRKLCRFKSERVSFFDKVFMSIKLFFFMPVFMFIQVIPRLVAFKNFFFSKKVDWYKTERTKELITE